MPHARPYPVSEELDRALGAWCFNRTWELMDKPDRSAEEDEEMLMTTFASGYHWSRVGTPVNFGRSEWQIARVYVLLGNAREALHHARRCLEITEGAGLGDFDLAFAYEGMARALALSGQREEARAFAERAAAAGEEIREDDDRQIFMADLATLPTA